jgi:hypothetical protein
VSPVWFGSVVACGMTNGMTDRMRLAASRAGRRGVSTVAVGHPDQSHTDPGSPFATPWTPTSGTTWAGGELGIRDAPVNFLAEGGHLLVAPRADRMHQPSSGANCSISGGGLRGEAAATTIAW